MAGGDKPSLGDQMLPLLGSRSADFILRQAAAYVTARLLREGTEMWSRDSHLVGAAIDKVERAWALSHDPAIAVQLATLYDRANRNDEALVVLREAFRQWPADPLV